MKRYCVSVLNHMHINWISIKLFVRKFVILKPVSVKSRIELKWKKKVTFVKCCCGFFFICIDHLSKWAHILFGLILVSLTVYSNSTYTLIYEVEFKIEIRNVKIFFNRILPIYLKYNISMWMWLLKPNNNSWDINTTKYRFL